MLAVPNGYFRVVLDGLIQLTTELVVFYALNLYSRNKL